MDKNISNWFIGFEKGIAVLDKSQQEKFFCECGKNCVQQGLLGFYQDLYNAVEGDINSFFERLNNTSGFKSEIIELDKSYYLYFEKCSCALHTEGYVHIPLLCECSRQSVMFVMNTLWKDKHFDVEICSTILRGAKECKLRITAK
ncbi:MAG: hypothetical protein ACERKO_03065 [Acetanaerobacterium sp.]